MAEQKRLTDAFENQVQRMQGLHVLQILRHVKDIEQLIDVALG